MTRRLAAVLSATALAILGSGAAAWAGDHKELICHPNNGAKLWSLIDVAKASSHFDDAGNPKHRSHDGRVDTYAVNGVCPGAPTSTPTGSPSTPTGSTPSVTPTTATSSTSTPSSSTTSLPSPSTTSSTPTTTKPSRKPTGKTSSSVSTRPPSAPTTQSTRPSASASTSPLPSVPFSTGELAHTGADLSDGAVLAIFGIALGLLLGWCAWILGRDRGDRR